MSGRLDNKRVLVVEDEYFIASDLRRALEAEGAAVLGPVARVEAGLALVVGRPVDAAVLDVNLDGDVCFALLDRLRATGVPCLLLTGYDQWALPERYHPVPRIAKPFAARAVLDAVERLMLSAATA